MATQLILYPQNYSGVSSILSSNPDEMLVDGINFATMNSSPALDTSFTGFVPASQVIIQQPPTFPNSWYRFRSTSPQPTLPTASNGSLTMSSPSGAASTVGIYQKLTSLTVGTSYTVTVNLSTTDAGAMNIHAFSGAAYIGGASPSVSTTNSTITKTFTAPATTATIMVIFTQGTIASTIVISHISVVETGLTPSLDISNLEDGQVICDLYEDETIPLTLSVDNFKNAAEQVQSYSKAFDLPATKRNNQIFENLFEVTRSAQNHITFNPYAKTKCALKQDGFILFEGYLRVLDVSDKEGEISYNVNLYSEVISFADVLGDKDFNQIDFSELNHAYNYTNIKNSAQGILALDNPLPAGSYAGTGSTTSVLRYPFVDWEHSYTVGTNDKPVLPNIESSFRPFIKLTYLIRRIFADTNLFTYTSNFIDNNPEFQRLYMDFNWGSNGFPAPENRYSSSWDTSDNTQNPGTGAFTALKLSTNPTLSFPNSNQLPPNYDETTNLITATTTHEQYDVFYQYKITAIDTTISHTIDFQWVHTDNSTTPATVHILNPRTETIASGGGVEDYVGAISVILENVGDTLQAQFKTDTGAGQFSFPFGTRTTFTQSSFSANSATLNALRGELGQWEFIKGIMTMFNLVSMPDPVNPNNIIIEPYKDIFQPSTDPTTPNFFDDNSEELDWTEKVDISEIKLTPLTDLNKTTLFKFVEDDEDYIFNVYKNSVQGHLYGSKLFDATLTTGGLQSVLSGEEEIVAEPFAATVSKPLMSQFYDFIVPSIYSYNPDDGTSQGFDNSPRIMYHIGTRTSSSLSIPFVSTVFKVPAQNGSSGDDFENEFLQFCHLTDVPTVVSNPPDPDDTIDFHFGECQLINPIGDATPNNLFNTYWLPYFNELYNPDTRTMTLKVNLSPGDINTFRFYDTVFIKNRTFRVNKIDYKPNDLATVEFILIP